MLRYLLSLHPFWFIRLFIWPRRCTSNMAHVPFPLVGRCHESDLGVPGPHVGSSTNTTGTAGEVTWNHCMSRVKVLRQPAQTSQGQCRLGRRQISMPLQVE
ncbi:hypothetical protein EV363DRAFT_1257880 [Boletus edulis]|nr:hypothetical protein EV363DRAFT_1257880 [Boletus edulis]